MPTKATMPAVATAMADRIVAIEKSHPEARRVSTPRERASESPKLMTLRRLPARGETMVAMAPESMASHAI